MKNKLISQKTRSRASKVVLALFLCTIMISSLCSFTVGDTFTFPETPPEFDYQTYTMNEGESEDQFAERVFNYGSFVATLDVNVDGSPMSVPFYYNGDLYCVTVMSVNGVSGYIKLPYSGFAAEVSGNPLTLVSYTDNDYTIDFLNALIPPPPTPTESLTNVWDGILNWITTSISSLQNVFWQEGTVIDFNSNVDSSDAITINDTVFYKSSFALPVYIDAYTFMVNGSAVNDNDVQGDVFVYDGLNYTVITSPDDAFFAVPVVPGDDSLVVYTNIDVDYYIIDSASSGLTLLGTLCCIAVAISVVFLLIGTIVNFLKLRS